MAKTAYTKKGDTARFDQLYLTTMDRMQKDKVFDQYFRKRPTLAWLLERKDSEMFAGSEQFIVPLQISENPNGGWVGPNEGVSLNDYDPLEAARYHAKNLAYNVTWTWEQQRVNRGEGKIHDLVKLKIQNTVDTITKMLSNGLWTGAGTDSGKEMDGLPNLVPATVPASQTVTIGGLSPSDYAVWRTQAINLSGTSSAGGGLEDNMITLYNNLAAEGGSPSAIFSDQTTHETYEKNALDYVVYKPAKIADVTFELCHFKGIPMIFDKDAPTGELRMIDSSRIKFCVDPGYWFEWTDWKESANMPFTKYRQVVCVCNLVRTEARVHGCIFNISE